MKKIAIIAVIAIAVSISSISAQTDVEAIRYAQSSISGTARGAGLGNAMGALGGDFTSLSINPAGLGIYRSSEIMITPSLLNRHSEISYLNTRSEEDKYNFNINNLGAVFSKIRREKGVEVTDGWVAINFGLGFNRIADYNGKYAYSGVNSDNSILDSYVESSNGFFPSNLSIGNIGMGAVAAYQSYLTNPLSADSGAYSHVATGVDLEQNASFKSRGANDEFLFAIATNYKNKIYLGASFGIPYLRYNSDYTYSERAADNSSPSGFRSLSLTETLKTEGVGLNFKLGMIVKPVHWLRLGGAVHSPTYYTLSDDFELKMGSVFDTLNHDYSINSDFEYNLSTPWKVTGSAALVFRKFGLISFDYEWLDYSNTFYDFDGPFQLVASETNQQIDAKYKTANNIRVGVEIRHEVLRFRAGYNYLSSPLRSSLRIENEHQARQSYNFGFGIQEKSWSLNLAYIRSKGKDSISPYSLSDESAPDAELDETGNRMMVSVGFRF